MKKPKKRKQYISILLIPDDYSDPFSFKIKFRTAKILTILAVILTIHILVGAIYYYKFSVTDRYRKQLEADNIWLKEDNRQVYALYEQVNDLLKFHNKFKSALEVDRGFKTSDRKSYALLESKKESSVLKTSSFISDRNYEKEAPKSTGELDYFLTRKRSNYHNFANNIPTFLPVEGFLSTDFRKDDNWKFLNHLGIDIATSRGTEIKAAADGVVVFNRWTEDLGNLVIVSHLNDFLTFYGHTQIVLVRERSFVKKGQTIALLGSSGRSTAPHLHFEIWKNGVPIDPKKYLLTFQIGETNKINN